METRWHAPVGVDISDTKFEDRIKELHISAPKFNEITAHLSHVQNAEAAKEVEETKRLHMKESSNSMRKEWSDSVQHQQKTELDDILNQEDDQNLIRFLQVKKEQEAERKIYVDKMRQKLMMRHDFPKALGSAYLFSQVLHEREQQKEFGRALKQHKIEEDQQLHADMIEDCAKYAAEENEKVRITQQRNKAHAQDLLEQIVTTQGAHAKERAKRIAEELIDQERARRESENIERVNHEKLDRTRNEVKKALLDSMDMQKNDRLSDLQDNQDCDIVTKIVQQSKDRIHMLMKKKEKELMEAHMVMGAKAFDNSAQMKRDAELQLIYERGVAKFQADDEAKIEAAKNKQARLRQERRDYYKDYLAQNEVKKKHEKEVVKWEMLNRFKSSEEQVAQHAELVKKGEEKKLELVKHLDTELKLKQERLEDDGGAELREIIKKNAEDDKEYLEYANEIKNLARQSGWTTLPIQKVITKYRQDVMGDRPRNKCSKSQNDMCSNKSSHFSVEPGRARGRPLGAKAIYSQRKQLLENALVHQHEYNTRFSASKSRLNEQSFANTETTNSTLFSLDKEVMIRPPHGSPSRISHLDPCSEPNLQGPGFFKRYVLGFLIFCTGAVIVSYLRELGYNHEDIQSDVSFIKDQMNSVKVAIAHVQKTKQDSDVLYKEMHHLFVEFKKITEDTFEKQKRAPIRQAVEKDCGAEGESDDPAVYCDDECQKFRQTLEMVTDRVQAAMDKYNADKTGMADYALETVGGKIESIGNTQTFYRGGDIEFLGFKLCSKDRGPAAMIHPSVIPGDCWAFKGQSGNAIIKLVGFVHVTGISLEHIDKSVSPTNELESAPKEFSVFGIYEDTAKSKIRNILYGRFKYDINGTLIQYFTVTKTKHAVSKVEVKFHNNYGNEEFTCVYRLRVHGFLREEDNENVAIF